MSDTAMRNDIWAEAVGVPEYQCHKRVRAAKIACIAPHDEDADTFRLDLDGSNRFYVAQGGWMDKHKPEVGGYLVFYADGYVSYSPAKAFEEGYRAIGPMGCGEQTKP